MIYIMTDRNGDSAKASKRSLAKPENPNSDELAVAVVTEKPSFLKLNKKGKATTTTTSCHTENESALWLVGSSRRCCRNNHIHFTNNHGRRLVCIRSTLVFQLWLAFFRFCVSLVKKTQSDVGTRPTLPTKKPFGLSAVSANAESTSTDIWVIRQGHQEMTCPLVMLLRRGCLCFSGPLGGATEQPPGQETSGDSHTYTHAHTLLHLGSTQLNEGWTLLMNITPRVIQKCWKSFFLAVESAWSDLCRRCRRDRQVCLLTNSPNSITHFTALCDSSFKTKDFWKWHFWN